jgi:DNA-binding GntR family transcriptional regulator
MAAPPLPRLSALDASPALVERAYRALLDAIVSGELAPGERHTQDALAERLGVSRQPVLQALLLLRRQGLVRDEPGRRGVEVAPLSAAFVQHLYLVRGALDGLAARSAAYRPRPELREPGMALVRAGREAAVAGDIRALVDADLAFHRFLYEAAHNPLLVETAEVHWHHTRRAMATYLRQPVSFRSVWSEHQAILNAVVRGDARLAERAATEHCEGSAQSMLRQVFDPDGTARTPAAAGDPQPTRRRR